MKVLFRCQSSVLRWLQRFTADNGLRWTRTLKKHSRYARKPSRRTEPQVLRFNPHQKLDGIVRPCLRSVFCSRNKSRKKLETRIRGMSKPSSRNGPRVPRFIPNQWHCSVTLTLRELSPLRWVPPYAPYKLGVGLVCVQLQDSPHCTTTVEISDVEPTIFCQSRRVGLADQESSSYFVGLVGLLSYLSLIWSFGLVQDLVVLFRARVGVSFFRTASYLFRA